MNLSKDISGKKVAQSAAPAPMTKIHPNRTIQLGKRIAQMSMQAKEHGIMRGGKVTI